ncbi:apoptosis regulator BAX-like [Amblyraja radiata]|uniref:apoptosis regulator BAX-like n=1 Tax=Amblyraja radiata TaxID=386614 RepID=UPI001402C26D|nr:apoptosis regulator BAX-like [Amblyraja radiata]
MASFNGASASGQQRAQGAASTSETLTRQSGAIVRRFVLDTIQEENPEVELSPEDLGGASSEINEPDIKDICKSLKKIGDELNRNAELQQVIDVISVDDIREVLHKVAERMLASEGLNWGRIVTFLYFAGKLVLKALKSVRSLIQPIINWSLDLIQARVIPWIEQQGGWETIFSYLGSSTWPTFVIFSAGVITGILAYLKLT